MEVRSTAIVGNNGPKRCKKAAPTRLEKIQSNSISVIEPKPEPVDVLLEDFISSVEIKVEVPEPWEDFSQPNSDPLQRDSVLPPNPEPDPEEILPNPGSTFCLGATTKEDEQEVTQPKSEKSFSCMYCPSKMRTKSQLKEHTRIHTGEKPFECSVCFKRFSQSGALSKHKKIHEKLSKQQQQQESQTTEIKRFKCEFCSYSSNDRHRVKDHTTTHTGDKPYHCSYCPFRCSTSACLNTHEQIHSGVKAKACNFCDYVTYRACTLQRHLLTHTGSKTQTCELCGAPLSTKGALSRHLRQVHSVDVTFNKVVVKIENS